MANGNNTASKQRQLDAIKPHEFSKGQSGNPSGRPKGSRNKLGEAFIADLYLDWEQRGIQVIEAVRQEKPEVYLKVVASLIPKELNLNINEYDEMTDEQLITRLRALQKTIGPFLDEEDEGDCEDTDRTGNSTTH